MKALKVKVLDQFPCICYPVQFRKNKDKNILALLNSENEVNAISPAYTAHLGLKVRKTNVGAQKIDKSLLPTYSMVIAAFQVIDKLSRSWFFQDTFLLADISMKVVLGLLFLILSHIDVQFAKKKLS